MSKKDVLNLREKLVEFIEYTRAVVHPSEAEELVSFTCDYYVV